MKWLIGVGLVVTSPLIILVILAYVFVWKLPLTAYELAHEIYKLKTDKKHDGIGWY